ncbi:MAG TPA: hypothetical protein VFC27_04450 [Anaerovoracaceae bacterium]|nr:hypothetical protein [Anaerovoracaceae bacterium]
MNNRLRSSVSVNVSIFGVGHALIDAACAVVIFSLPGMKALSPDVLFAIIILYNGLAFAMQAPIGFLADFIRKPELTAVVGCLLTAGALLFGYNPVVAICLAGIGNALFHIGGGIVTINLQPGKAAIPGLFIAPGCIGVLLGTWIGQGFVGVEWIFVVLLLITAVGIMFLHRTPTGLPTGLAIHHSKTELIIFLLLLSVVIRSFIGLSLAYPWKTGITLPLIFILAVFFGKAFGGILADRFGWMRISIVGLLLSAPLLFFGAYEPVFAIFGIFFFNLTMPVTLVAIANLLPRYAGFSLGLTTMAIFIGLIAAVTPLKKIAYAQLWPISIIILCSAGILFIGLRLYNMSMKNPDCKVVETETTAIVEQL